MVGARIQGSEVDSFRMANSLLKNPPGANFDNSFEEVLESKVKEVAQKAQDKATDVATENKGVKKKKVKENPTDQLPNVTQIIQNVDKRSSREIQNTYLLLDKFRESRKLQEDELLRNPREQLLNNAYNVAGQPLIQPVYDQGQRRPWSRAQILENWERYAPLITEDITKKSVRIDIPLLNDVQALVLRMHPDRSITASILASKEMAELLKQNKDKLDRNLRHHHLSLREFNTYRSELEFTSESGTRKKKRQPKSVKKLEATLV